MKKVCWVFSWALLIGVIAAVCWGLVSPGETPSGEKQYTADEIRLAIAEGRVVVVSPPDEQGKMLIKILPEAPPVVKESEASSKQTTTSRPEISGQPSFQFDYDELARQQLEEGQRWELEQRVRQLEEELRIEHAWKDNSKFGLEVRLYDMERMFGKDYLYHDPSFSPSYIFPEPTLEELNDRASDLQRELEFQEMLR
jgi:hypothetical protein